LAGLDLGRIAEGRRDQLLVATTERLRREEMDAFVAALDAV